MGQEKIMGAKRWMLVYADRNAAQTLAARPLLDRDATSQLVHTLFPKERLAAIGDGDLSDTSPPDDELHNGCFAGVSILAAKEFGIDRPSTLPVAFIAGGGRGTVCPSCDAQCG